MLRLALAATVTTSCASAASFGDGDREMSNPETGSRTGVGSDGAGLSDIAVERPRLLVMTDIGGDPDDMQSLRRLLLYANEFRIAGLIATASGIPGQLEAPITRPELIAAILDDYAGAYASLRGHDEDYPHPDSLRTRIRSGSPQRGLSHLGAGRSTAGSELIIATADAASPSDPVRITIWGGAHDLAQALFDVRATRNADEMDAFLSRLRVYAIADQDAFAGERGTGEWIFENFPSLHYVETGPPGMNRYSALFRGMYQNDSRVGDAPALPLVRDALAPLVLDGWVETNVRSGHGPLGAGYPIVAQNPATPRNGRGVKEGDTPSWFYFLPNGLSDPERPGYGGWGGRFVHRAGGRFVDGEDEHWSGTADPAVRRKWTVARWREAYQNDFAARMDQVVKPFTEVNHNPVAVVGADSSRRVLVRTAIPGNRIALEAGGSYDPDGDRLEYRWWIYGDASDYSGEVELEGAASPEVVVHVPEDAAGHEIHVILEVVDNGEPRLTGYRRVVLRVQGAGE